MILNEIIIRSTPNRQFLRNPYKLLNVPNITEPIIDRIYIPELIDLNSVQIHTTTSLKTYKLWKQNTPRIEEICIRAWWVETNDILSDKFRHSLYV